MDFDLINLVTNYPVQFIIALTGIISIIGLSFIVLFYWTAKSSLDIIDESKANLFRYFDIRMQRLHSFVEIAPLYDGANLLTRLDELKPKARIAIEKGHLPEIFSVQNEVSEIMAEISTEAKDRNYDFTTNQIKDSLFNAENELHFVQDSYNRAILSWRELRSEYRIKLVTKVFPNLDKDFATWKAHLKPKNS